MKPEDLFTELEESSPAFRKAWALEEPRMRVAQNIYRLRSDLGLTRQELARRAGMRQPRFAELERGDTGSTPARPHCHRPRGRLADLYARVEKRVPRRRQAHAYRP